MTKTRYFVANYHAGNEQLLYSWMDQFVLLKISKWSIFVRYAWRKSLWLVRLGSSLSCIINCYWCVAVNVNKLKDFAEIRKHEQEMERQVMQNARRMAHDIMSEKQVVIIFLKLIFWSILSLGPDFCCKLSRLLADEVSWFSQLICISWRQSMIYDPLAEKFVPRLRELLLWRSI